MTDALNRYWNAVEQILQVPQALAEQERAAADQSQELAKLDAAHVEARKTVERTRKDSNRIRASVHDALAQRQWEGLLADPSLRSNDTRVSPSVQLDEQLKTLRRTADEISDAIRETLPEQAISPQQRSASPAFVVAAFAALAVVAVGLLVALIV